MSDSKRLFPLYSKFLCLYPKRYREQYGEQLLQTTADMLNEARSPVNRLGIWTRVAIDLLINVFQTQFQYVGEIVWNETPSYVKRNSLIGGAMLLPLMAALIAKSVDKVTGNRILDNVWFWKFYVIRLWMVWLPEAAFLLMIGTYIYFLIRPSEDQKSSLLKRAADIRHSWLIIVPGTLALGILFILAFHDSGQCWVHSPTYISSHLGQGWHCTIRNQSLQIFRKGF